MSRTSASVIVTGGTGLIGGEVVSSLLASGWDVHAVARGESDLEASRRIHDRIARSVHRGVPRGRLTCQAGSVTAEDLGIHAAALDQSSVLLHCAGETAFNDDERCWRTNVGAAERLVELGRRLSKPLRICFVSTASVCMAPTRSCIDEATPFGGFDNGYTRSKRRAEELLLASGLDVVVLRPTIVFSRGVEDRRMARAMLWVIPALIELGVAPVDAGSRIDIIPVDYAAAAIAKLLELPRLRHRIYHVSAGAQRAATCGEFQEAVARVDPRARAVRMSATFRKGAGAADRLRRRLEESISYYVPFMSADVVYSNGRLLEEAPSLGLPRKVTDYVHHLLGQFAHEEGIEESARP
jgi:nucleoside-diphosphate-sugar epimerase